MPLRDQLWFDGPVGRLEARAHGPEDGAPVLLCHPHPQAEGTMGSRLTYDLAKGLGAAGWRVYRFNYRGVGRSEGTYGDGNGEAEDALSAYDAIVARHGACGAVVGHSFGGGVALRVAVRRAVDTLVLVATPARVTQSELMPLADAAHFIGHAHVVIGSADPLVPVADAQALAAAFPERAALHVLNGADHFLTPAHTPRVLDVVRAVLEEK